MSAVTSNPNIEHGVAFGKHSDGTLDISPVASGTNNSNVILGGVANRFADLHYHPTQLPPSSGDTYSLIDRILNNPIGYLFKPVIF